MHPIQIDGADHLRPIFDQQRAAFSAAPYPSLRQRLDRLATLDALIRDNKDALIDAIDRDFGNRARTETILAEYLGCRGAIHHARSHLRRWMRPRRRQTSLWSLPGKSYAVAQPLGVVGVMAPWNYALHLAVAPMVAALAAGNRVMLCMSEEMPRLYTVFARLVAASFDPDLIAVVQGGPAVSPGFAALPFDHLLFTGSTRVGRLIAAAAARNLTPVTLELGGKSPAIVAPDFDVEEAARRIAWGKAFNSGQTCIAPDYVLLPATARDRFAQAVLEKFAASYNSILDKDYTAIVSERFFRRLRDLVEDARQKGATILQPPGITESVVQGVHKFPLTVVLDPPQDSRLMQEEIFGPILPVLTYGALDQAVAHVNAADRPLALYCFTHDPEIVKRLLRDTVSGSFAVNETLVQYLQEDLAFGGVGASGQGAYHGQTGFDRFSHLKSVFEQRGLGHFTGTKLLHPPYGPLARAVLRVMGG